MRTIENIQTAYKLIEQYRSLKERIAKARCIVGGYLHYENYHATVIDRDLTEDVKRAVLTRLISEGYMILHDLAAFDIDVSLEFKELEA